MKNRTVLARLAALGMSMVLCFGIVACGEKEETSRNSRTEKEADEEEEKEEDSKENENKEAEGKKANDGKKENAAASGKDEARQNAGKEGAAANAKEERTPAVSDGKIAGHYVASVEIGEDFFMEEMDKQGNGDMAEAFKGVDLSFDITMDLKDDGTGVMSFDPESIYDSFMEFFDEHFVDIMTTMMEKQGTSKEDMLAQAKQAGYDNLEDFLMDYKDMFTGIFEKAMRDTATAASSGTQSVDLTWQEKGDQIAVKGNSDTLLMDIGSDGSLSVVMPADQSPTESDIDLVFIKQ